MSSHPGTAPTAPSFNLISNLPTIHPLSLAQMVGLFGGRRFKISDTPSLEGKIAVITGGQAGIGKEISVQLLLRGVAKVYILARSESKFVDATLEWTSKRGLTKSDVEKRTEFMRCDLCDIQEVQRAATYLVERLDRIDILINNAALPISLGYKLSPQGIEEMFAVNHVGHFTLTNLLLPLLKHTAATRGGDVRVVATSSSLHLACPSLDVTSVTSPTRTMSPPALDGVWRYARSKLANILFTRELARKLDAEGSEGIFVNCFFPGNIPTDAMDVWKDLIGTVGGSIFKSLSQLGGHTPLDGATTALYLAAGPAIKAECVKGRYFVPIAIKEKTSKAAQDPDLCRTLWEWSEESVSHTLGSNWLKLSS